MVLSGMIDAEPQLEVVDTAQSREELLFKAMASRPDLIVAQFSMTMSGRVPFFQPVFGETSSLLLMVSQDWAQTTTGSAPFSYLHRVKPFQGSFEKNAPKEGLKTGFMSCLREFVGQFISGAQKEKLKETSPMGEASLKKSFLGPPVRVDAPLPVVAIGASTGGSSALEYLIKDLSLQQPAVILVAVHMPEKFTRRLARRLQKLTTWRVEEGFQGMALLPGTIVIAPGGQDMRVKRTTRGAYQFELDLEPSLAMDSPSVDALFQSAACCAQEQVLGIILTGMGQDGTAGARVVRENGGVVIAQNEETSTIFGMAKSAIESGAVNGVFALGQINSIINRFVTDRNMSAMLQQKLVG